MTGPARIVLDRARDLLGLAPLPPADGQTAAPPPPRIEVTLDGAVPGAVVRLLPLALVLLCAGLAGGGPLVWTVAVVVGVFVTWRPAGPAAAGFVLALGLSLYARPDLLGAGPAPAPAAADGLLRVAGLVLGVHLLLRVAALCTHVAWRGVVETAVLSRAARAVLGVQLVAQTTVLAVVWLRGQGVGAPMGGQWWLRLAAVLATVAVAVLVMPRAWLRHRPS